MNQERPNFTVKIVCLANSRKTAGRCIAGKELDATGKAGRWIRPISGRPTHEISELEMLYPDGQTVKLFEVLEIPCEKPAPQGHQPENVLIDPRFFWQRQDQVDWQMLNQMLDEPSPLWINGFSTHQGHNNRIPEHLLDFTQGSLRFIALDRVSLHTDLKNRKSGNIKQVVRASFDYLGDHYCLDVTDPVIESYFLRAGKNEHLLESALACISLTEPWEGYVYKLAASLITPKRVARHE
jgi:hypothetical protein